MSQELVHQTIKKFQDKLLDLSAKNKLLNFKFKPSEKQIRVINDSPDRIYKRLNEGKKLSLQTLPEPDSTPPDENSEQFQQMLIEMRSTDEQYQNAIANDDETPEQSQAIERLLRDKVRARLKLPKLLSSKLSPTPQQQAQGLGINPAYDLPSSVTDGVSSNLILQTLLFPKEFERKASGLLTGARTSIQETGRNTLYLAFGMLEWFKSDSSNVLFQSPLLLYPVNIERESVRGQYRYFIKAHEDEVEVNPCLRESLRRDFGIELPDFQEAANTTNSPDAYFREVAQLIEGLNRWQVRRFVNLSLFSFGNFALYNDIDPENWANDGLASHPIVSGLLGGSNTETHDTFRMPSDYEVDKPDISRRVPLIISETDASQFSAIVDVMDGKNLVIEGPPGTGKSQTITNLIAAALAKGKTVLFVAEKMAAVEVVRDRIEAVGLREFCLEIHSTNKPKSQIYKEIKARCELESVTKSANPNDIEHEYIKNRQQLTDYVNLLNQPFGEMGDENKIHTIQEILWRAKSLQQEFKSANIPDNLLNLSNIANPLSLTRFDFDEHRTLLRKFIRVQTELNQADQDISIWEGIRALDIDPIEQDQLVRSFAELSRVIADTLNLYQNQTNVFDLSHEPTLGNLKQLNILLAKIPELPTQIETALLMALRDRNSVSVCRSFVQKYCEVKESLNKIQQFFESEDVELPNLDKLQEIVSRLYSLKQERQLPQGWDAQSIERQVNQLRSNDGKNLEHWRRIFPAFKKLQSLLNINQDLHLADISHIAAVLSFVESTPEYVLRHRNSKLCNPKNLKILSKAESLQKKFAILNNAVHLDRCKDSKTLRFYAQKIISAGILFFIDPEYHKAHKVWESKKNSANPKNDQEISSILNKAADFWDEYADLKKDEINQICGELYREFETDYKLCYEINGFGHRLEELVTHISCKDEIRDFAINSPIETLKIAVTYNNHPDFQGLQKICQSLIDNGLPPTSNSSSTLTILENYKQETEKIYQDFRKLELRSDLSLQELSPLMLEMHNYQRSQEELDSPSFTNVLGTYPQSELFSLDALQGCLDWAEAIHKARFPQNVKKECLSSNVITFIAKIKNITTQYQSLIQQQEEYCKVAVTLGKIDSLEMFDNEKISDCSAVRVRDRLQQLNQLDSLQRYLSYSQIKAEIKSANLWGFVDFSDVSNLNEEQIDCLYRTIFYRSLVSEIHKKHTGLRLFKGEDQQIARQEFKKLDREILKLYQGKLAAQLAQNQIPKGNGTGLKNTWTEQALIRNEISKQSRLAPLRSLFQRSGRALQALHPCWMMSPASVAQFLPSNSIRFDLIVIDEASQMRPEEALGVIARGKQLVVVGDPMQLPPTDFFKSINVDGNGNDEESILDMTMKTFSVRRLKWHYRSRHESLIAFSNKHFYDNTLTVFPSPNRTFAINYHYIAEGLYQSGVNVNPIEAKRVVEATLEFMRSYPNLSLGVVALNKMQRDLIEEEMDLIANTHPEVASYIDKWEKTLSSFFIKNLENVQGDERDIIFISTVYGRARPDLQHVAQNFGPINKANGHRRLNVLFTRAKERIEVFSSMTSADILPTEASSRGVHALKNYLEYIQTKQLETARLTGREPDSDFEIFVAKAIRDRGFKVVAQVGVANYFIDLAIVDPNRAGTYLLGIECDGATYHSSKAARDRDRYRQEVLEKLGWKLYRIWSTDWFRNPDREIEKLVQYIHEITRST
jgi:very-short-patch-repair endonuclease